MCVSFGRLPSSKLLRRPAHNVVLLAGRGQRGGRRRGLAAPAGADLRGGAGSQRGSGDLGPAGTRTHLLQRPRRHAAAAQQVIR